MKRIICAVIAGIAIIAGCELTIPPCGINSDSSTQSETLVIDLSKRLPDNPYQEEYEKMLYPTVRIMAGNATGSGVIIETTDEHRLTQYILTAAHVVGDQSEVTVEIFYPDLCDLCAFVVMTDTVKDLAILKPVRALTYKATLAPRDYMAYIFTPVYAVGCSLGYPPRPSNGIISVITDSYWEVTSPILPGNSGGPVFNANTYEVIGITVWVHTYKNQLITTMAGVVPINEIYEFLKEYTDSTDLSD